MSSLTQYQQRVRNKEVTITDLAQEVLGQIEARNDELNCFIRSPRAHVEAQAQALEKRLQAGEDLPLAGVPIGIKDVLCLKGFETTCASKLLAGYVPPYTGTAIGRLQAQGALLFPGLNCDEFAMGSSTENSAYGVTRNPWNTDCVPGGSSGGSSAVVGAGLLPAAIGTDTGGSIRQPAAFCGVVGYKPTYGAISRYGLVAFASSFDQIGPFTTNITDAATLLEVMAGDDPHDSTCMDKSWPMDGLAPKDLSGLKVGVIGEFHNHEGLDPEIKASFDASMNFFKDQGAQIKELSLSNLPHGIAIYYVVAVAEASSNLARFDGIRYGNRQEAEDLVGVYTATREHGFGPEVKRRILLGTYVLSEGYGEEIYKNAKKVQGLIAQDFAGAFGEVDILISPTTPSAAFKFGEKTENPMSMYLSDVFTVQANLAGLPGLSIPCGFTQDKRPIGLQMIASRNNDRLLLETALAYEKAHDFAGQVAGGAS